jgi:hypothetical protein
VTDIRYERSAREASQLATGLVLGIDCQHGHFNDPSALFCCCCGTSLVHSPRRIRRDRRPPLGTLIFDDGSLHAVDADLTLRSPPTGVLARCHARIELRDWLVQLVDLGSPEGTYVAGPGTTVWRRIRPGAPERLCSGTRIRIGVRTVHYESNRSP